MMTADMIIKLQKDPEVLEGIRQEMKKLQNLGFIKKLKDLPRYIQDDINAGLKHFTPTTVAFKETSASTKIWIC